MIEEFAYENLIIEWQRNPDRFLTYCQEKINFERAIGHSPEPYQMAIELVRKDGKVC